MAQSNSYTLDEAQLKFAKRANMRVWELLSLTTRSPEQNEEMVYAANACTYLWLSIGTGLNQQRGEWLIAHVHTVLGNVEEALRHAQRCAQLTEEHRELMEDFDLAYSLEALARAHALAGNQKLAERYLHDAQYAGKKIADEEDHEIFWRDLRGGEWYGLQSE